MTFIDYYTTFDSVSHKFLDTVLNVVDDSNKCRTIFRCVYVQTTVRTKVKDTDGKHVLSVAFSIDRDVVQGDTTSPLYFILAFELILKRHDTLVNKDVDFGKLRVFTLGCADDVTLLDSDLSVVTTRAPAITQGSREDSDMSISIDKTKVTHACVQGETSVTTDVEAKKIFKHKYKNVGCNKVFHNSHDVKCHADKCHWRQYYLVEKILDVRGETGYREFLIKWEGHDPEHNT